MSTNNAVGVGLSGATGTGNFVGSTSPTLTTPTIGAATATSVAFSPTTGGIIGTTAADNAGAGKVGEVISSSIASGSAVTFTSGTPKNLTSIVLTAGDWDVQGNLIAVGTTVISNISGISTTTGTLPDVSLTARISGTSSATSQGVTVPYQRFNVSGNTTVFLVGNINGTGTINCSGNLSARRAR